VADVIVTFCTDVYVPAVGLNVGMVTETGVIAYAAKPTGLEEFPEAMAMA
jgi:hypothetical protein